MEVCLSKYTNIISKMKERLFIIKNDELKYKISQDEENENRYQLDTVEFIEFTNDKADLSIQAGEKNLIVTSTSTDNLKYFCSYLNLEKLIYSFIHFFFKFYQEEKYKFNAKEYIVNLRQYAGKEIFLEILNNIQKRKEEFDFVLEILKSKLDNLIKEAKSKENFNPEILDIINKTKDDYLNNCFSEFKEKTIMLGNFQLNSSQNLFDESEFQEEKENSKEMIIGIESIHLNYLNLCRLLLELKKSVIKIGYLHFNKKPLPDPLHPMDTITKYLYKYIRSAERNCLLHKEIEKEKKVNFQLKEEYEFNKHNNSKQKENLKLFLLNKSFQVFFCFKCGNLLKRTIKTNANCKIDSNCKINSEIPLKSNYCCLNCKISFCNYCVIEIKNGKCSKGHLMFKFEFDGEFQKNCLICQNKINLEGYGCNLCDVTTCCNCFETVGRINSIKCPNNYCKFELRWCRRTYSKCNNCFQFKPCHWGCFFCETKFCIDCAGVPNKLICGTLHKLDKINLKEEKDSNALLNKNFKSNTKEESRLPGYSKNLINISCSICENVLTQFSCCRRCDYVNCCKLD